MKKEQALEAMKNGAVISHITWDKHRHLREVDGRISTASGNYVSKHTGAFNNSEYDNGWFIVGETNPLKHYQSEQLLKAIPLHLEDPNRVWCNSGHDMEEVIAEKIRELHAKVRMHDDYIKALEDCCKRLANEVERMEKDNEILKDQVESLKSAMMAKDETIGVLRERMNHF